MQKLQQVKEYFAKNLENKHLRDLLKDEKRSETLLIENKNFLLDLTRENLDEKVMEMFQKLYKEEIKPKINSMVSGEKVNVTENREVLHYLLRKSKKVKSENPEIKKMQEEVFNCLERVKNFSNKIREGKILTLSGEKFKNVISIGIGGSALGTESVYEALKLHPDYFSQKNNLNLYFLSNVDPACFNYLSKILNPLKTLVIVVSKSFTTAETLQNANLILNWIKNSYKENNLNNKQIVSAHFTAISSNVGKCKEFGIGEDRVFPMWNSVGGRFSVSSAVGCLPISLALSWNVADQFLEGMESMDDTFFGNDDVMQNIPCLLALVDAFHNFVQGFNTKIIIPYSQGLHRFPAHIQQVEMESIGKKYNIKTKTLMEKNENVAQFVLGEPGTNSQHSFFQTLHQGRVSPIEFIGFCKPQMQQIYNKDNNCYNEFMANLFAQADAFALGNEDKKNLFQHFEGNRPNFVLLFKEELNAFNVGILMSLYENRCAAEGFLCDINTFDQYGVNLGKVLAKDIKKFLVSKTNPNPEKPETPSKHLVSYFNQNVRNE